MLEGSCLCGAVRYRIDGRVSPLQYCHCPRCRKASGGPFVSAIAAKTEEFRWTAGEHEVAAFEAPVIETPPGFRTRFCKRCGSPLPIADPGEPYVVIPAGSLDGEPDTRAFRHIFYGRKASWFALRDDLPKFEGHVPPEQRLPRKSD